MALTDMEQPKNAVDDVIDLELEGAKRQRFRINGDPSAIIELNLSDLGIVERLEKGIKQLEEQMSKIAQVEPDDEELSKKLKEADTAMRECIDYIFDYPVSAVCAKYGTMYDPKDGKFRYEHILEGLTKLYNNNINEEYKKFQNRIKKHTAKYTVPSAGKSKKTKGK